MFEKSALYQFFIHLVPTFSAKLSMQSTESKLGLLLEDAQTALEQGVKRGAVKMDMQLEIRYTVLVMKYAYKERFSGRSPSGVP